MPFILSLGFYLNNIFHNQWSFCYNPLMQMQVFECFFTIVFCLLLLPIVLKKYTFYIFFFSHGEVGVYGPCNVLVTCCLLVGLIKDF